MKNTASISSYHPLFAFHVWEISNIGKGSYDPAAGSASVDIHLGVPTNQAVDGGVHDRLRVATTFFVVSVADPGFCPVTRLPSTTL